MALTGKRRTAMSTTTAGQTQVRRRARKRTIAAIGSPGPALYLEEARQAGLLSDTHPETIVSRVPRALLEAARAASGVKSPDELVLLAMAMLAQPDPVAEFLKETRGNLGPLHKLEY